MKERREIATAVMKSLGGEDISSMIGNLLTFLDLDKSFQKSAIHLLATQFIDETKKEDLDKAIGNLKILIDSENYPLSTREDIAHIINRRGNLKPKFDLPFLDEKLELCSDKECKEKIEIVKKKIVKSIINYCEVEPNKEAIGKQYRFEKSTLSNIYSPIYSSIRINMKDIKSKENLDKIIKEEIEKCRGLGGIKWEYIRGRPVEIDNVTSEGKFICIEDGRKYVLSSDKILLDISRLEFGSLLIDRRGKQDFQKLKDRIFKPTNKMITDQWQRRSEETDRIKNITKENIENLIHSMPPEIEDDVNWDDLLGKELSFRFLVYEPETEILKYTPFLPRSPEDEDKNLEQINLIYSTAHMSLSCSWETEYTKLIMKNSQVLTFRGKIEEIRSGIGGQTILIQLFSVPFEFVAPWGYLPSVRAFVFRKSKLLWRHKFTPGGNWGPSNFPGPYYTLDSLVKVDDIKIGDKEIMSKLEKTYWICEEYDDKMAEARYMQHTVAVFVLVKVEEGKKNKEE